MFSETSHESTLCKLQIKCQVDVSHICHVTRSQYALQQGSVCIKNNINICKTNKALGTDLFFRGFRSYENLVGKKMFLKLFQSRIITKSRVSSVTPRKIYYYTSFLACKMSQSVNTGPFLKTKTNCQTGPKLSDQVEVLADSSWR